VATTTALDPGARSRLPWIVAAAIDLGIAGGGVFQRFSD
jgi:hypothetical protein